MRALVVSQLLWRGGAGPVAQPPEWVPARRTGPSDLAPPGGDKKIGQTGRRGGGPGPGPRAEQRGAFSDARGIVLELVPILELARRAGLLPVEMHESLKGELETLSKMLTGLIRGGGKKEEE